MTMPMKQGQLMNSVSRERATDYRVAEEWFGGPITVPIAGLSLGRTGDTRLDPEAYPWIMGAPRSRGSLPWWEDHTPEWEEDFLQRDSEGEQIEAALRKAEERSEQLREERREQHERYDEALKSGWRVQWVDPCGEVVVDYPVVDWSHGMRVAIANARVGPATYRLKNTRLRVAKVPA